MSEYLDGGTTSNSSNSYAVTFSVGAYEQTDFTTKSAEITSRGSWSSASELGSRVNVAIFQEGTRTKSITQSSSDSDFGTVSTTLSEGDYEVVILVHSCTGNATTTDASAIKFTNNKITDTFLYYNTLSVSAAETITADVARCVAMFRLTIEDEIPSEVTQIKFYYTGGSSTLNATTGYGCVQSKQTEYRDVSDWSAGQVFDIYTIPHDYNDTLKIVVTALDASENTIAETTFTDVPVTMNMITTHSCSLFSSGSSSNVTSFTIGGDATWDGEIEY